MREPTERNAPYKSSDWYREETTDENDATVLVAMAPTDRRRRIVDATAAAVADAVEGAAGRATYTRRVAEFSEVAAEAAASERESPRSLERVGALARDARAVQDEFSPTDWTAAFRSLAEPNPREVASKSQNRTS